MSAEPVGVQTELIYHHCPYKEHSVTLASCYMNAEDIEDAFCYGCDEVPKLKEKWGLRTYNRKARRTLCVNCGEVFELHRKEPPHTGVRVPWCPGYQSHRPDTRSLEEQREGQLVLHIPLDVQCRTWMVVFNRTGERMTLADYRAWVFHRTSPALRKLFKWTIHNQVNRFKMPLAGAPSDLIPVDRLTQRRHEVFSQATKTRRSILLSAPVTKKDKDR